MDDRDANIRELFSLGLTQTEILEVLRYRFGISICARQLRRILARLGLRRRRDYSDIDDVIRFIENQLETSGQLHGYRWMHLKCLNHGLVVRRETVRVLLSILDPAGVECRRSRRLVRRRYSAKGPNFLWHLDSYDKLKPFGICINGCIDGFSRYVLWLESYRTNSDPKVIAGYFINTVSDLGGCPRRIRMDLGTENGSVAQMQEFFREDDEDEMAGPNSYLYGRSTANQRIESWWGILRKENAEFWMALFHELQGQGLFNGYDRDKELIRFCFQDLIQDELNEVRTLWNAHRIRKYNNAHLHHGRPFMMYYVPEINGAEDYLHHVDDGKVELCKEHCSFKSQYPCDKDMYDLCCLLMDERGLTMPSDPDEARDLYFTLRDAIITLLV